MLTNPEKLQVRQLLQTAQWKAVENLANMLCDKIRENPKVRPSEWETMQTLLMDEGEVRGIRRLIQELYNTAIEH